MKPIALLLLLTGCAFSQAVDKEKASREALLSCLQQNKQEPQKCAAQALIYQSDKADLDRRMVALNQLGTQSNAMQQPSHDRIWQQNMGGRTYSCNNFGGMVNCH